MCKNYTNSTSWSELTWPLNTLQIILGSPEDKWRRKASRATRKYCLGLSSDMLILFHLLTRVCKQYLSGTWQCRKPETFLFFLCVISAPIEGSLIQPTLWFIWLAHMHNSLTYLSHSPSNPQEQFLLKILKLRDLFAYYTSHKFTLFTQNSNTTSSKIERKKMIISDTFKVWFN